MRHIVDPEVRELARYSMTLQADYRTDGDEIWQGSPFAWIRERSSPKQKGTIGEKLLSGYLALKGFDVARSPDSQADRLIGGERAEIKMSTLWENGSYKFQQIRNQNYHFVLCLGISPFDASLWAIPKKTIMEEWKNGGEGITSQHGGSSGTDTAWLGFNPDTPPSWLSEWGGNLAEAVKVISRITGQKPLK